MSKIDVQLPPSSQLNQTNDLLKKIQQNISKHEEVQLVFTTITEPSKAELLIKLKPHNERQITQKEFEDKIRGELANFSDLRFAFSNEMAQRDVSILLTGNDPKALNKTAQTLKKQMQGVAGLENVQVNAPLVKSELHVKLLADEAARLGVTPQAVGNVLQLATVGDVGGSAARFNFADRQVPIRIILENTARNDLETLKRLQVSSSNGGTVSLGTVAELSFGNGAASLERFDRERRIAVEADLTTGYTIGDALAKVNALPVLQNLPETVRMPEYGDAEYMNEMFEKFGWAMGFGVLMVLAVLIVLFRDFLQPLTILIALPLSIGGALLGLMAYGAALDMSSVIGVLMLMGIVTKNSILLVDFVIEKRKQGVSRFDALIQSGSERVRPILMTTIAVVAGMIPAVFAGGAGAAFRASMAVAVICGLIASTLLSLVFVPVMYSLMDDLKMWLAPKMAKMTSVTVEDKAV